MPFSDQTYNLRIDLDTAHCTLSPPELERLERGLHPLRNPVAKFPISDLHITIEHHPRSNDYRVKLALQLPKRALTTGDRGRDYYPAFESSVRKLVHKLLAYESRMANEEQRQKREKGTRQDIDPLTDVDENQLREAVENGDYAAFYRGMFAYEEPLRKRIGRWIERYPELEEQLDEVFGLDDVVEEVILNAFDQFEQRPQALTLSDWLENLIDPSLKLLSRSTSEELENISYARSLREEP